MKRSLSGYNPLILSIVAIFKCRQVIHQHKLGLGLGVSEWNWLNKLCLGNENFDLFFNFHGSLLKSALAQLKACNDLEDN